LDEKAINPFFIIPSSAGQCSKPKSGEKISLINSIAGLDVTNYADGIARFLVERTKAELNAYFFTGFRKKLKENIELQTLFPNTSGLMDVIGEEIYNYNSYINSLRQAYEMDLSNLFINFQNLIKTPEYQRAIGEVPNLNYFLQSGFHIIEQLNSKIHPGNILHNFSVAPNERDILSRNINNGMLLLDVFSQSLTSTDSDRYWITTQQASKLLDEKTFAIYMGLIYLKLGDIEFINANKDTIKVKAAFDSLAKNIDSIKEYKSFVMDIVKQVNVIDASLKKLSLTKAPDKPNPQDIYYFINSSLDLFDMANQFFQLPYVDFSTDLQEYNKYLYITHKSADLYSSVSDQKYGMAITNLVLIFDTIYTKELVNKLAQKEDSSKIEDEKKRLNAVRFNILKYGTFMATIVDAKSSTEVAAAIETVSMPVGGFRVKRSSDFNVALNGYLGFFGGYEYIPALGAKKDQFLLKPNNYSLSAPVGVSFTWYLGNGKGKNGQHHTLGLFASVIDVGAIASYRFGDDSVAIPSAIQFKDVFAPGINFAWNIRNAPITILAGVQMGPLLREVSAVNVIRANSIYWRYGISVVVDIPIINFYNKRE